MRLDKHLIEAAIAHACSRFPDGYADAAAIYTSDGRVITSVRVDTPNEIANLCHETVAICEAYRLNLHVVASVCVSRSIPPDPFIILAPRGICQGRLATWDLDVEVAVPLSTGPTKW